MVEKPEHDPWSSAMSTLAVSEDSLVTPHACFNEMESTRLVRAETYRAWLAQVISHAGLIAIRRNLHQERASGSKRFQAMAKKTLVRPVSMRRPGRPRRAEAESEGI